MAKKIPTWKVALKVKKGWQDPLKFFLDHGADVNARDLDGKTTLSMALTKPRRPEKPAQETNLASLKCSMLAR